MNPINAAQAPEQLAAMVGEGQLLQSEMTNMSNQESNGQAVDGQVAEPAPGLNISLNELAAGTLTKAVDSAAAISQFAVGTATGLGTIALQSVNGWFTASTNAINTQFSGLVNRFFGVNR